MTYHALSDSELVAGYNEGIVECFTEIYNRYWAILYRHALRMLRDECASQDVVQETFHSLIRHGSIQDAIPLRLLLYTTVRNRIINDYRREKVREKYLATLRHYVSASECTEIQVRERELQRQIEMEISRLPERMRLTFELSRKQHCDYKTIAERTSTSTETVRKQIHNAIRILRTKLSYF
ncbi:RNA polymerase sigma-70 factor, ECF subfamily [Chitinophaga eiseniae]|uniref:RNA polymerase sigma-70 factor, ECF subfamily n=1 Tax=Chitinophaga eiseniae TaxID=634771 RepID=A0A1T4N4P8_9BACT|nr:sigma-70 family RNA polymerase sigma factor [Chitinophaga eiseniae]SJZ74212.1 RNA polymerase sigma-70 factor, ECF subfamily [Chitinophaga eiseniae]